jgi:hypothetical protein
MRLNANESKLVGKWELREGRVVSDAAAKRIEWLIEHQLVKLRSDWSGWETLYRDPSDGRLWELTYPESDSHGGGPPELTCMSLEQAREKYGDVDSGD